VVAWGPLNKRRVPPVAWRTHPLFIAGDQLPSPSGRLRRTPALDYRILVRLAATFLGSAMAAAVLPWREASHYPRRASLLLARYTASRKFTILVSAFFHAAF